MIKKLLTPFFILFSLTGFSQLLTWSPDFATESTSGFIITVDANKGNKGLLGQAPDKVYVHIGVITNYSSGAGDWKHVQTNWGTNNSANKAQSLGNDKWSFTITGNLRSYFQLTDPNEKILKIAILFRSDDGSKKQTNADGSDMFVPVYTTETAVRFTAPPLQPLYNPAPETITKSVGDDIQITAIANKSSTMKIYLNGNVIQTASGVTTISVDPAIITSGNQEIVAEANDGTTTSTQTITFFASGSVNVAPLPAGVRDGINYINSTTATLVLYAPGKGRVAVIGDLPGNNWTEQASYQMNKTPDGDRWWITVSGLTPGKEYSFQYLVNGTLRIADPYSELIQDPYNDQYISTSTYPNLKPYPSAYTSEVVGILQTASPQYTWDVTNFNRPDKRNLMVYELLVRDFVAKHDWVTLRDTLNYLKKLGINAIEIMPFNEFEGNISWGYNPDFYFAPDKYYGPANTLKEFIDSCHKNGIAVVMDIALNHSFGMSPMVRLYWDAANNRPAADNPWFNPVPKHAYNVGYDMNHESPQTKYFVGRVLSYWLNEYKIDGFRFDLSKGFTQKQTCDNNGNNCDVNAWSQYDQSRVDIWHGYYDTLQNHSAGSYCILEHFAVDAEEIALSNLGMLLWGNMNYNYNQATMGYSQDWNFDRAIAKVRGWTNPYLVSYMESHDEERLMYKNLQYGNSFQGTPSYNIKSLPTALQRQQLGAAFLLTIPGPKMIWQFGELGYDYSINYCQDGTISGNCRTDPKPIRWDYLQDADRRELYNTYRYLLQLRKSPAFFTAFTSMDIDQDFSGSFKWLKLNSDQGKLVVIGNFDITTKTGSVIFPSAGTWYDYLNGNTITATGSAQSFTLKAGEFHVYTNIQVPLPVTMVSFNGIHKNGENILTWNVAAEVNLSHYEVERSTDGVQFTSIASINAAGKSSYQYTDAEEISGSVVYYRIKIADNDGSFSFSNVIAIKQESTGFAVWVNGNPFSRGLKLKLNSPVSGKANIVISGIEGKRLIAKSVNVQAGSNELSIPETDFLSKGVYFMKVIMNENTATNKIIKL